ncbi:MAG: dihydroneopterin aldolase [Rhodobacteraceae bacterium]|uniref:dihydroneopterin aldolase n=1 Tax=Albidovulum sp. TaxID=1872424 RepID=UPI001D85E2B1|nr:dihydroneopterin aldolase [Paracoccaceae bacterium]HRV64544.1 dihydroneopterin aldolase [Albidovulum sp.]MCB2118579.1 dihydroneopterin aldolase [Paracoccaceae bacterium]MCB2123564.1 dihydroneopterin aldolase [Paracoccaceae bacterium]MCB2133221.1 dihydroneopterin aldolase [Paracoccaceae bacterium]
MTDNIAEAFEHPEARARASGGLPDRLSLRDFIATADIGAFQEERGEVQRLRFNIVVEIAPLPSGLDDDVDRILSYDRLIEAVEAELSRERLNLLETLAEGVAARILAEPQARRVFLRVEKLDRGPFALGVEIVRDTALQAVQDAAPPPPVVVHLSPDALRAPDLAKVVGYHLSGGDPVVLTLGLPEEPRPDAGTEDARRRIALLAIEQNAWALAARDTRLKVVATRTELDWALRHGRPAVWAPSKIVLDTPGAPVALAADGAALALWLAELLGARCLIVHGTDTIPAGSRVPVQRR